MDKKVAHASHQHWVLCKLGRALKHQLLANLSFSSSRQITISFCTYLQQHIFNQQRFRADGLLIPNLHKALAVRHKLKQYEQI